MNVMDAIRKRKSTRSFKPDPIPEKVLEKLLEALRLSPSGGNLQPRRFILVRDKAMKAKLADACKWHGRATGQEHVAQAPVVIVACGSEKEAIGRYRKDGELFLGNGRAIAEEMKKGVVEYESCVLMDVAIALDHLTLAAVEEGLGTVWVGGFDEREIKRLLSVPDDWRIPIVMPLGYPVSWPDAKPRKLLQELVCYDKYSWT